jgi:hypothetical protein
MADFLPINGGRQQSSFKYFTVTLKANEVVQLYNPFNCFRCYDATANFQVAWSANTDFTDFGEGMMVKFEGEPIPGVFLKNPNASMIVVKVGMGIGTFEDSRLSVSGNIQTVQGSYYQFSAQTLIIASGTTTAPSGHNILQNTGSYVMYLGGTGTDGLQLQPQGTFEYNVETAFTVYGTDGDTLAVGSLV